MSPTLAQLLALAEGPDIDSAEFIDRLAGAFKHCQTIDRRANNLVRTMEQRVAGIRWNTFVGLAEIGEALLRVQEQRPQGFTEWFQAHQARLGFKERHADHCKSAARAVREHGLSAAYAAALKKAAGQQRETLPTMRVPLVVEGLTAERARELLGKLKPICEALTEKISSALALTV
jgi:hypothetical protein